MCLPHPDHAIVDSGEHQGFKYELSVRLLVAHDRDGYVLRSVMRLVGTALPPGQDWVGEEVFIEHDRWCAMSKEEQQEWVMETTLSATPLFQDLFDGARLVLQN